MRPIIIDSNNLCFINFHAFGGKLSYDEQQTGILWGFFNHIIRLAKRFESNRFIFTWDSRKSLRKIYFPEYKAQRQAKTEEVSLDMAEVYAQFELLRKELLPEFGFKNIYMQPGYEADDLMASLVRNQGWAGSALPVIVSTDKDLYQLLDVCDVYRPITHELITSDSFTDFYTVRPHEWVAVKAMAGDTSDNVPGIKGVGEKTAIKFVRVELKETAKTYAKIVSPKGQSIVARNTKLMFLPWEGTEVRVPWDDEAFNLDDFLRICDRFNFLSFQKTDAMNEWRNQFGM